MVRRFVAVLFALALIGASVGAAQDQPAKNEFGADVAFTYVSPDGGESFFTFATPVDLRVGFLLGTAATIEPRLTALYISKAGDFDGDGSLDSFSDIGLGANVTYGLGAGGNRRGLYITGGAAIELISAGQSENLVSFNGGVGTRSGLLRAEAFVGYVLENTTLGTPNTLTFGARLGVSLWN